MTTPTKSFPLRRALPSLAALGLLFGATSAQAAQTTTSEPGGTGPEPCLRPTGEENPELRGVLRATDVPYAAGVGQPVRLVMEQPKIFVPSTRCADQGSEVAVPRSAWSVVVAPAGASVSAVAGSPSSSSTVTPDRPGRYTIRYTACPGGCTISGRRVPALSQEVSFRAVPSAQTRLSSDAFALLLGAGLRDTRIQISHTNGPTVSGTPYTVGWSIPAYKYEQLTNCDRFTGQSLENCMKRAERIERAGETRMTKITPSYRSYIDFGPAAEANGAPASVPFSVPRPEAQVPTFLRALIMAGSPGGFIASTDLDRVRLSISNLNQTFRANNFSASIGEGKVRLSTSLDTGRPAIICEGHYQRKVGYALTVSSGWSDSLCPNFDLEPIRVDVALAPSVDGSGQLFVGRPSVALGLKPRGVTSSMINFFGDITGKAAAAIGPQASRAFDRGGCKSGAKAMGTTVRGFLTAINGVDDLGPILSAKIVGSELVISYEPVEDYVEPCDRVEPAGSSAAQTAGA